MKKTITEKELRDRVREAISNTGWSGEGDSPAVNVNPVVDPSSAMTDPVNPDFTPQDHTELGIAVQQLTRNLPNSEMPAIYKALKGALDKRTETEEIDDAQKQAMLAGSQEAIDDMDKQTENKQVEARIRRQIRKQLAQMGAIAEAPKRRKAYKPGALGNMADVEGASFEDIAKDQGMSVAGAKQLVDKSLEKLRFLWSLPEDDRDILILTAANDYIKMLAKTGELTAADVQLMKDHPEITTELDGFREFLHNAIRKARKSGQKMEDPLGESDELDEVEAGDEVSMKSVASDKHPQAKATSAPGSSTTKATGASGKGMQVDWGGFAEGRRGKMASMKEARLGRDGMPVSGPVSLQMLQQRKPIAYRELMDMEGGETSQITASHGKLFARSATTHYVWRPETEMWDAHGSELQRTESKKSSKSSLFEGRALVQSDKRGPFLVADGVEVRPRNPNQTQYKAGLQLNVHKHGKKGTFIVEMPNGEKWTNKVNETGDFSSVIDDPIHQDCFNEQDLEVEDEMAATGLRRQGLELGVFWYDANGNLYGAHDETLSDDKSVYFWDTTEEPHGAWVKEDRKLGG